MKFVLTVEITNMAISETKNGLLVALIDKSNVILYKKKLDDEMLSLYYRNDCFEVGCVSSMIKTDEGLSLRCSSSADTFS